MARGQTVLLVTSLALAAGLKCWDGSESRACGPRARFCWSDEEAGAGCGGAGCRGAGCGPCRNLTQLFCVQCKGDNCNS